MMFLMEIHIMEIHVSCFQLPFVWNQLKMLDPIMIQTMKQENIIPSGTSLFFGIKSTGVHKKTKMYIQLSMML